MDEKILKMFQKRKLEELERQAKLGPRHIEKILEESNQEKQ